MFSCTVLEKENETTSHQIKYQPEVKDIIPSIQIDNKKKVA
jgi:hypothetical protein